MIWKGWTNGKNDSTGAGYGFKLAASDRDLHFKRIWCNVSIELPKGSNFITVEANVAKESFWGPTCRELINREVGRWMLDQGLAPWQKGTPPTFVVESLGDRRFRVKKV